MSTELSPDLKKRFTVASLPDGGLLVEAAANSGSMDIGASFYANGIMVALFGYVDYELLRILGWKLPLSDTLSWIVIATFVVLLGSVFNFVWTLKGRMEWEVRPNELRWRRRLLSLTWEKVFRNGGFLLRRRYRSRTMTPWYSVHCRASGRRSGSMFSSIHLVLVEELAGYLAAQLGWTVEQEWK